MRAGPTCQRFGHCMCGIRPVAELVARVDFFGRAVGAAHGSALCAQELVFPGLGPEPALTGLVGVTMTGTLETSALLVSTRTEGQVLHKNEASWIVEKLRDVDSGALSPMPNIGSSTRENRRGRSSGFVMSRPIPSIHFDRWKRSMRKLRWLVNPNLQSCVIVRKEVVVVDSQRGLMG